MNHLATLLILACVPSAILDLAIPKWKADKAVHIEDAYKWLYQATRGGEHAAPDEESARKWLDGEWQTLESPLKMEPEWGTTLPRRRDRPIEPAAVQTGWGQRKRSASGFSCEQP
jgi:hypothetical protein